MKYQHLDKYVTTAKQRGFERNFFLDAEKYEVWEEVKIGEEYEASRKFEVKAEDIKAFSAAVMDTNPLFNDEEYAKKSPWGGLIAHPLFFTAIGFYCTSTGHSSWIRTPGAYNPGQKNLIFEPFRVGDIITLKLKSDQARETLSAVPAGFYRSAWDLESEALADADRAADACRDAQVHCRRPGKVNKN